MTVDGADGTRYRPVTLLTTPHTTLPSDFVNGQIVYVDGGLTAVL